MCPKSLPFEERVSRDLGEQDREGQVAPRQIAALKMLYAGCVDPTVGVD